MIADFGGDFISAKNVADGDILEIMDEGKMEYSDALKKDCFNIKVNHIQCCHQIWIHAMIS